MKLFFNSIFSPLENIHETAISYANLIGLKVTEKTLTEAISKHPDYPSMLALYDVLSEFGAETIAAKIDPEEIRNLQTPFIAFIKPVGSQEEHFTVAIPDEKGSVKYLLPHKRIWKHCSDREFTTIFSGIALFAESNAHAGENEFDKKVRQEKQQKILLSLVMFLVGSIFTWVIVQSFYIIGVKSLWFASYFILALIGSAISLILLWYEVDRFNPFMKEVCSGKKAGCDSILQSKVSKIAGVSWSVLGFSYFCGVTLSLLGSGLINSSLFYSIGWLSLLCLSYVPFSLYYQWRIAKQWCILCLATQGVLVTQAVVVVGSGILSNAPSLAFNDMLLLIVFLTVSFIGVTISIPGLKAIRQVKQQFRALTRLKQNYHIFETLLLKQKKVTESTDGIGILLGNPNASTKIIKVCNPYCGPCSKVHPIIEDIIVSNSDVSVRIIFAVNNSENDYKAPPVRHLMALADKHNENIVIEALHDWYSAPTKDYALFAAKYPMNGELERQGHKLVSMWEWCNKLAITATPTIFINEYQLPDLYNPTDLKYLLKI